MKKILAGILIAAIVVIPVFFYWKYYFTYSEGYRAGLLQKFSYRGNFFKTHEGELILSSVQSNTNVPLASEKFFFSVTEPDIVTKLNNLEGHMIVVHYVQKNGTLPWRGETPYLIDSVRVVNSE